MRCNNYPSSIDFLKKEEKQPPENRNRSCKKRGGSRKCNSFIQCWY